MVQTPQLRCYTDQSLSALHHALRASRRRLIVALIADRMRSSNGHLSYNRANEAKIDASQLAREIVAIEEDIAVEAATGSEYHTVYTTLTQTHLPKLNSLGVIEYQSDQKKVRPGQNFLALATAVSITSPVTQLLFDESISEHSLGGPSSSWDSTGNC